MLPLFELKSPFYYSNCDRTRHVIVRIPFIIYSVVTAGTNLRYNESASGTHLTKSYLHCLYIFLNLISTSSTPGVCFKHWTIVLICEFCLENVNICNMIISTDSHLLLLIYIIRTLIGVSGMHQRTNIAYPQTNTSNIRYIQLYTSSTCYYYHCTHLRY